MIKNLIIWSVILLCTVTALPFANEPYEDSEAVTNLNELEVNDDQVEYRLSHDTEPRLYIIEFDPDFEGKKFTFKGNATIFFEVIQPTTSVTLHRSQKIVIDEDSTEIIDVNGTLHQPLNQQWNPDNDFYTIKFEQKLEPGNYSLKIKWISNDDENDWFSTDSGFFRVQEDHKDENSNYLIATLFQPISARTAFPCWDEPGFKAQFEISIKHFPNYTALSNMPEKSHQQLPDGRIITNFERSVKMSSYNPCIVVANCKPVKSNDRNISFYGLTDNLESLEFPLKISEMAVQMLESYTDIPYPLPKLDHFTIPEMDMPAMENWGLITYPSPAVTFHNTTLIPNVDQHDSVSFLVAHEVTHQWFGDLVTSVWWDDLWLSEAFATFFPYKMIDQMDTDRSVMDYFTIQNNNEAFDLELSPHRSKPIKWEPKDKDSIIKMFGTGTYFKGSAVIQMLENVLTENVFRDGIRRYLKAHQFGTVTSDNLWEALQEAYDEAYEEKPFNVKEFMDPWIIQEGSPIVTVTRNYETGETNITQKSSWDDESDNMWKIPINYATESNPDFSSTLPTLWMNKDEKTITLPSINKDDWIIVNIKERGFYRVNYDEENWKRLAKYLNEDHEKIHPVNRAQLIANLLKQLKDNPSYIDILFKMTLYLHREKDYLPWMPLSAMLSSLTESFLNTDSEDLFKDFIRFLTDAISNEDLFDQETLSSARIRKELAPLLCQVENSKCLSHAQKLFDQFLEKPSKYALPPTDWYWVVCTGLKAANNTVWDRFMLDEDPLKDLIPHSDHRIIKCTNDNEKRDRYLMKLIQPESNSPTTFMNIVIVNFLKSNRKDVDYIIQYFCDHFEDIEKFYNNSDIDDLRIIFRRILSSAQNQDQLDKMKILVTAHKDKFNNIFPEKSQSIDSLLEGAQENMKTSTEFIFIFQELIDQHFTKVDGNLKLKNL